MIYDVEFRNYYCNWCKITLIALLIIFWIILNSIMIYTYSKEVY